MKDLESRIFSISSDEEFNVLALELFEFQRENNPVYREYLQHLAIQAPAHFSEIPFLPISFFKTHCVLVASQKEQIIFRSSGTTGMVRSQHFVASTKLYEQSFLSTYRRFMGDPEEQIIIALLPNYLDQGDSSLVYMVDALIQKTGNQDSGFYLDQIHSLPQKLAELGTSGKKVVLFGVSYALLDLAELKPDLRGVTIVETGGMKGRRKEMLKEELHRTLCDAFNVEYIVSEYGMSELLSQGWSDASGLFSLPPWMRVQLRDVNDPLSVISDQRTGGVNVIDLANMYSCPFIATQDLGRVENGRLRLMGRFDHSDIRGCNLLVQ